MTPMTKEILQQLLVPFLLIFFFIGGLFSLAVGAGLIAFRGRMFKIFTAMDRWISYRKSLKPLSVPRESWPTVHRYRIWFAAIFVADAVFSLFSLIKRIDVAALTRMVSQKSQLPPAFIGWIIESLWWLMVAGSVLALVIGLMLAFFPRALAMMETGSARWYSTRHLSKGADSMHPSIEKWVATHPRTAGILIVIGSLVEVIDIGTLLF